MPMDAQASGDTRSNVSPTQSSSHAEQTDTQGRYFTFPKGVTIEMDQHERIRATQLHVKPHGYTWADELGGVILEHKLSRLRTTYIPWKRARYESPLTVEFANNDMLDCWVKCSKKCPRIAGWHKSTFPSYLFSNPMDYGLFQSAMRDKVFVHDFEATSINCKGSVTTQGNRKQCIKLWSAIGDPSELTLTIPFNTHDGDYKIKHLQILPYWMNWETSRNKGVKATFIQRPPSSPTSSFQFSPRRFSWKSSRTSTSTNLAQHDVAPADLAQLWKLIEIDFATKEARDKFFDAMTNPSAAPTASPALSQHFTSPPDSSVIPPCESISPLPSAILGAPRNGDSPSSALAIGTGSSVQPSANANSPRSAIPPLTIPPSAISPTVPTADDAEASNPESATTAAMHPGRSVSGSHGFTVPSSNISSPSSFVAATPATLATYRPYPQHAPVERTPVAPSADLTQHSTADVNPDAALPTVHQENRSLQIHLRHEYMRIGGPRAMPRVNTVPARSEESLDFLYQQSLVGTNNKFRILRIKGGRQGSLRCDLLYEDLSDLRTPYEAISYCWGTQDADCAISSGHLAGVKISEHLLQALERLRLNNSDRHVWIDALCVNQNDKRERTHQLNLIPRIYKKASRTIIWIGDLRPSSEKCPRGCPASGDNVLTLCVPSSGSANEHEKADGDLRKDLILLQDTKPSNGGSDVWWRRLWCVQEFYFSQREPSVYIGPHAVPWKKFYSLFGPRSNPLDSFRVLKDKDKLPTTLRELFLMTGAFNASDPRDRVFGLLGMARSEASEALNPSYHSSVIRVIEDACLYMIKESGRLDVLLDERVDRTMWGKEPLEKVMPTWLPDLSSLLSKQHFPDDGNDEDYENENAGQYRSTRPVCWLSRPTTTDHEYDNPRTLHFKGVLFDIIDKRTEGTSGAPDFERSPNGYLIYNSLKERGHVVEWILDQLDYDFDAHLRNAKHGLEPNPRIGLLMLDYLLEGMRDHVYELGRRSKPHERNLDELYKRQHAEDLEYIRLEQKESGMDLADDIRYVEDRWRLKIERAKRDQAFTPARLGPAFASEYRDVVRKDHEIARNLGNLFAYARGSYDRYYLNVSNAEAPMRKDVLGCATPEDVKMLPSQYETQGADIEIHPYNAKSRERDFFKTRSEWIGLGPSSLRVGDQIVVPLGASRPFILRECEGGGSAGEKLYTLVGEAHVPSIMNGKWMGLEQDERGLKTYQIR